MQKDLLYRYGKYFEKDDVVLDSYSLNEGYYIRIDRNGNIVKILEVDKNSYENLKGDEDYEWFKNRDFYSNMLDMNKSIRTEIKDEKAYKTAKKLMSNNHLTIFFKNNIIKELYEQDKDALPLEVFKKVLEQYYDSIEKLGSGSEKWIEMLELPEISQEEISICKNIFINNIANIIEELKKENMKNNTRIKIFIEDTVENYDRASQKYYALKIFNSEDYNQIYDDELYGANNYNFGMNSKKPYNELKTTSYKVPSRLTLEEIKAVRNIYIWLIKNISLSKDELISTKYDFSKDFKDEELNELFVIAGINDNGNLLIEDFQYIPKYTNKIKEIIFKNYLNELNLGDFEEKITELKKLEDYINRNWCRNYLLSGYYNYENIANLSIDSCYKDFLIKYANVFKEFFNKLNDRPLRQNIDKIGLDITKGIILNELESKEFLQYKRLLNSTKSLNMYLILKEYLCGKGGENVENIIDNLKAGARLVLNNKKHIENEKEFNFLVGQLSYYLISYSKAEKLTQVVFEPIINAKNIDAVRKELNYLYKKYKHEIGLNNRKFNTAFAEVMAYQPKEGFRSDETTLLIGFLTDNLFYEKKGEVENE